MVAEAATPRSPTLAQLREWLTLIGAVVVVLGGLLGGVRLVVAPLHTEMQAVNGRLDRMDGRLERMETEIRAGREETMALREDVQNESKAVRADIAALSERLTRVETLLEKRDGPGSQEPPG